jgi:NAD(P)-dependent dehydrogenase (short-subunit alcohol dehydrogenase family)
MAKAMLVVTLLAVVLAVWLGVYQKKWKAGGAVNPEWLQRSLKGKTALITGANSGIGYETALQLVKQGASVIVASRDIKRATDAVDAINKLTNTNLAEFIHPLDLSSLKSVREFAKKVGDRPIDYLINNAGVMIPEWSTTEDGFEIQYQTNHLSHFLLTKLLLENVKKVNGRVINVSSVGHNFCRSVDWTDVKGSQSDWMKFVLYGRSKLANILFSKELAERGIISYSLHPGGVSTELGRHSAGYYQFTKTYEQFALMFFKTPWEGAQTTLYAVLCDEKQVPNGSYLADCDIGSTFNPLVSDKESQHKLWETSEEFIKL